MRQNRGGETHHIIPLAIAKRYPELDEALNSPDNMIYLCSGCHNLLTPKSLLTKIGIANVKNPNREKNIAFYTELNNMTSEGNKITAEDVMDVFDKHFLKDEIEVKKQKNIK